MAIRTLPDRDYVREVLAYDPTTGEFRWKVRPQSHFRTQRGCNMWNAKRAGQIAGSVADNGYRVILINHQPYKSHRLAWLLMRGEPVPPYLDHKDRDKNNNRIDNLRPATRQQNKANTGMNKNNTTGVKGVVPHGGRFQASISWYGVSHHLGTFDTIEEAAEARREAATRLHGEFARHE